eukprot:101456_1
MAAPFAKSDLLKIHKRRLDDGLHYDDKDLQQLSSILGGTGNLLTFLLSSESDSVHLNNDQLNQINTIITNTKPITSTTQDIEDDHIAQLMQIYDTDTGREFTYCFSSNNSFLQYVFGYDRAIKIYNIVHSKYMVIWFALSLVFYFAASKGGFVVARIVIMIETVIILIFAILSLNRKCMVMILQTFDFWLKILYNTQVIVTNWAVASAYNTLGTLGIVELFFFSTWMMVLLLFVASLDASNVSIYFKMPAAFLPAFGCTVRSLRNRLSASDKDVELIVLGLTFSCNDLLHDAYQIMAIFFWKQFILTVIRKRRCVLIKYSPFLQWRESEDGGNKDSHNVQNEAEAKDVHSNAKTNSNDNGSTLVTTQIERVHSEPEVG